MSRKMMPLCKLGRYQFIQANLLITCLGGTVHKKSRLRGQRYTPENKGGAIWRKNTTASSWAPGPTD